ncbi:MAG: hypothetical protein DPW14_12610, partial [Planctomycetes bacterium]|nr:hypothetical protein [Planctomycetota bacterium]
FLDEFVACELLDDVRTGGHGVSQKAGAKRALMVWNFGTQEPKRNLKKPGAVANRCAGASCALDFWHT